MRVWEHKLGELCSIVNRIGLDEANWRLGVFLINERDVAMVSQECQKLASKYTLSYAALLTETSPAVQNEYLWRVF